MTQLRGSTVLISSALHPDRGAPLLMRAMPKGILRSMESTTINTEFQILEDELGHVRKQLERATGAELDQIRERLEFLDERIRSAGKVQENG